jgi:hypothetical protein
MALLVWAVSYGYFWFYGCDCGPASPFAVTASFQSEDVLWKKFAACHIKVDQHLSYTISYTPRVTAMDGKNITISGFMQPLEAKDTFSHFLLCKNAPSCAYCPPSKPNEIVEIFSAKPMRWQQNLITISGTLHLVRHNNNGVFFQMNSAV